MYPNGSKCNQTNINGSKLIKIDTIDPNGSKGITIDQNGLE